MTTLKPGLDKLRAEIAALEAAMARQGVRPFVIRIIANSIPFETTTLSARAADYSRRGGARRTNAPNGSG
jgi:hypothetical protein